MMRASVTALSVVFVLVMCAAVSATVLHVPLQYETIQAGINAAVNGDTVLVAGGTYTGVGNRDIDFAGRAILLLSENGPEATVIDCGGSSLENHRGLYFHSGEGPGSVVKGFTIRSGYIDTAMPEPCGGGIYCAGSSPVIEGNVITENEVWGDGGGIYCGHETSPAIEGNTIAGNAAHWTGSYGGQGGGIACGDYFSSPVIAGNTITGNYADGLFGGGGGIACQPVASPAIENNTIADNTGSGILCGGSSSHVEGNRIRGNVSTSGGGIYCIESSPEIVRNLITANVASGPSGVGGGIYCISNSSPSIVGNTIAENSAGARGGGIRCEVSSSATALNSVVWGNSAGVEGGISVDLSSSIAVTYCDVEGGWPGAGNVDGDPMFVLAEKQDYRLIWESACIDAGHPDSLDPDGTRMDIGVHFFDQQDYMTVYLTPDATEIEPGGVLGVTFTAINRWPQPASFWLRAEVILPNMHFWKLLGPAHYLMPGRTAVQRHFNYNMPLAAPPGTYLYRTKMGVPPSILFDEDSFEFWVVAP
jgi:nitrous oxidase accessory protein NosD